MLTYIETIAVCAPGLDDWNSAHDILAGKTPYQFKELEPFSPNKLPRNEKRRASDSVKMAFRIGEEIAGRTQADLSTCASVFASSGGDYSIIHKICEALCTEEKYISPTLFHNSVHNAPAGYWAIAVVSHELSTSLSAYDDSFLFGLLEAMAIVESEKSNLLYVAYDVVPPHPLSTARKITHPFACGFLLTPEPTAATSHSIELFQERDHKGHITPAPPSESLKSLYQSNPIARSIPLLEALATNTKRDITYVAEGFESSNAYILQIDPLSTLPGSQPE